MATIETHRDPSFLHIIRDLRDDATALFRQEVALAKKEMALKVRSYFKNAVVLGLAAGVGLYAIFFLFLFADNLLQMGLVAAGIPQAIAIWFAPLLLGMVLGICSLLMTLKALRAMRREKMAPNLTIDSLREDKQWLKGKIKG